MQIEGEPMNRREDGGEWSITMPGGGSAKTAEKPITRQSSSERVISIP